VKTDNKVYFYGNAADRISSEVLVQNVWYHVAVCRVSAVTTLYLNGVSQGTYSDTINYVKPASYVYIASNDSPNGSLFKGFISNMRVLKGSSAYSSAFAPPITPLTNITNTKLLCCQGSNAANYAVSPGTISVQAGVYASAFNPFDTDIDTVMGKPTGYCTLNPLRRFNNNCNLSNGNLTATGSNDSYPGVAADIALTSGKWYYEFQIDSKTSNPMCGVIQNNYWSGGSGRVLYRADGAYITAAGSEPTDPSSFGVGDIIGVVIDLDDTAGYIRFYKNGVLEPVVSDLSDLKSDLSISTLGGLLPYLQMYTNDVCTVNYGQKPFKFPPSEGFQPLNYANLPSPGMTRPDQYVGATTYTGNGGTNTIDCGFKPDLVAVKARSNAWDWGVFDVVRSTAGNVYDYLKFNDNGAQATGGTTALQSYNTTGFTLGADAAFNTNNATFVAYTWKAGGNKGTWNIDDVAYASAAAAGLDGGTINPSAASVGTKQGFSILQYTGNGSAGATFEHGLTEAPQICIVKRTDGTEDWAVNIGLISGTAGSYIKIEDGAQSTAAAAFNSTNPTSTLITLGDNAITNGNTNTYIAYCWHNIVGVQKFGTYEGNGNANGPYVELGFRPAIILVKTIDAGGTNYDWCMYDDKRSTYNPNDKFVCPNLNKVENTRGDGNTDNARYVDFLSNGFKIRNNSSPMNVASSIIYLAWAESPMHNLYGARSNAL